MSKPKFVLNLHALTETSSVLVLVMTHGVIGNTAGFGPVVLGSSPSGSTDSAQNLGSKWNRDFLFQAIAKDEKFILSGAEGSPKWGNR